VGPSRSAREQRQFRRTPIQSPVEFTTQSSSETFVGTARDIALGGMFIETESAAPFGARVVIRMTLPGQRAALVLLGTVRWITPDGMGVQFGMLGARETHAITAVGRERDESDPKLPALIDRLPRGPVPEQSSSEKAEALPVAYPQDPSPSPFALTPSAEPPPVSIKPAPVIVPPIRRPPSPLPEPPSLLREPPSALPEPPQATTPTESVVSQVPPAAGRPVEPLPSMNRGKRSGFAVLFTGTAVVLLLASVGIRSWVAGRRPAEAVVSANVIPTPALPSAIEAPAARPSEPLANPPTGAAPGPSALPEPMTRFDRLAASAALDALAPNLVDCKIPSGRAGRIKVTFAPDGTVSSAKPLWPLAGTRKGVCAITHLKEARVAPFVGPASPFVYSFVAPR
jgi:hypothetical protein